MITIEKELCVGCGKCVKDCIAHNIILKDGKAESFMHKTDRNLVIL